MHVAAPRRRWRTPTGRRGPRGWRSARARWSSRRRRAALPRGDRGPGPGRRRRRARPGPPALRRVAAAPQAPPRRAGAARRGPEPSSSGPGAGRSPSGPAPSSRPPANRPPGRRCRDAARPDRRRSSPSPGSRPQGHTNAEIGVDPVHQRQHRRLPPAQGLPEARHLLAPPARRPARRRRLTVRSLSDYVRHVVRGRGPPRRLGGLQPPSRGGTMPYVTADDGAQIFYKDWGADGTPVILSHGWPLNADAWEAAALFLAEHGHRAIAHDRRGHGRSSQTWHGNEMDTYADDLACLIDTLDLRDLTLVGPLHRRRRDRPLRRPARHRPGRQARAGLRRAAADAAHRRQPRGPADRGVRRDPRRRGRRPVAALPRPRRRAVLRPQPQPATSPRASGTPSGCRAWPAGTAAAYECIAAFSATDFRPDLAKIDVPTLVIHGDDDQIVPVRGRRQAVRRAGRRRRAEGLRGRRPRLPDTDRDRLHADLLDFIDS